VARPLSGFSIRYRRRPAVVLIGGNSSSWSSYGAYFGYLTDTFVAAGVAVLTYDHRGDGGSTGQWDTGSFADLADDSRLRALVSETPVAEREFQEAERHASAMRRHRAEVAEEIDQIEARQDQLLDQLLSGD
jgi:pimeloyl-ACP methyl ester carboxylesterase